MTAPSSWLTYRPKRNICFVAPAVQAREVSVVIPVRDNQHGLDRLIRSIERGTALPNSIIVVDNRSSQPIRATGTSIPLTLLHCEKPGAAAARNVGALASRTDWIWFLDSDCRVLPNTLEEFCKAKAGPIGFAGRVVAARRRLLSRYYEDQEILIPQFAENDEPLYLITASALVQRETLQSVGYFDETFPSAAGEDIDLGLRMFASGRLAYIDSACVEHDFEECLQDFSTRFERYGRGNRILAEKYQVCLRPSPFEPNRQSLFARVLANIQYKALSHGYDNA